MMVADFKSMTEKQKQLEEILLGTTVPGRTPAKEVKSNGKVRSGKEDKDGRKSKSGKSKNKILQTVVAMTIILLPAAVLRLLLKMVLDMV